MRNFKKWFSLVEIIIASWILSIAVFWVYRLIWENTKIINNSWNLIQADSLFLAIQECIENIWLDTFSWSNVSDIINFNFWGDKNLKSCWYNDWNKIILDNSEYEILWKIKDKGVDYINWEININSPETKSISKTYIQTK